MTNKEFKGFVRLSSDQYAELKLNGSLVIEGRTIEYSPLDTIYMITDAGNMIDVANTTEGKQNDVVLNITNNILRAQLNQTIKTKIDNKQDKLTAGTNITIDTNNVISASGGLTKVVATDVDSESAINGQVLTANGSGGASWQNASSGKVYEHIIQLSQFFTYYIRIYTNSPQILTVVTLATLLHSANSQIPLYITLYENGTGKIKEYMTLDAPSNASLRVIYTTYNLTIDNGNIKITSAGSDKNIYYSIFSDKVREI